MIYFTIASIILVLIITKRVITVRKHNKGIKAINDAIQAACKSFTVTSWAHAVMEASTCTTNHELNMLAGTSRLSKADIDLCWDDLLLHTAHLTMHEARIAVGSMWDGQMNKFSTAYNSSATHEDKLVAAHKYDKARFMYHASNLVHG